MSNPRDWGLVAAFSTRPFNVLGNAASVLGLVVAVAGEFAWDSTAIPLAYLCALSLYLLVRYVRQERQARYAEAVQVMERAHRRLKEASDLFLYCGGDKYALFDGIQSSLSAFAEAFTLVTGSNCRASLKEVFAEEVLPPSGRRGALAEPKLEVMVATIVRSNRDESLKVSEESADLLRGNTDFEEVFRSSKPFHHGDLPAQWRKRRYKNSHWLEDMQDFPYVSTIVWPVEADPPMGNQETPEQESVIAFLCVDTRRRHAFIPRADVAFGGAFAHALYPALRLALVDSGVKRA